MKTLFITLIAVLSLNTAFAGQEETVQIIFDRTQETKLTVTADTFIPNIQGYACPVPAINLDRWHAWNRSLNHSGFGAFGVKVFALKIKNPDMQFCNWPSATEVFGEDFIVGAEFKLTIRTVRELVTFTDHNGDERTNLRETISSSLNDKELIYQASVELTARQ